MFYQIMSIPVIVRTRNILTRKITTIPDTATTPNILNIYMTLIMKNIVLKRIIKLIIIMTRITLHILVTIATTTKAPANSCCAADEV